MEKLAFALSLTLKYKKDYFGFSRSKRGRPGRPGRPSKHQARSVGRPRKRASSDDDDDFSDSEDDYTKGYKTYTKRSAAQKVR